LKYAIVLLAIVYFGCSKSRTDTCPNTPQYQALTSGARSWLPYTNAKNIVFENAALAKDTIDIVGLFIGDDDVWVGDQCPVTKGQFIRVSFFDRKSKDSIRTQVGLQDELRVFTKFTNLVFYDTRTVLLEPSAYRKYELNTTLDGKAFASVLQLQCSPADNCPTSGITKVYFSKYIGLVAYERGGVLWTLK